MNIFVLNKNSFDSMMKRNGLTNQNVEKDDNTFFISINNTFEKEDLPYFTNHKNVKVMYFDDTDEDSTLPIFGSDETVPVKAFTKEQAKELFKFIKQHKNKNTCIIHCAAGISRSAACAVFINDYVGGNFFELKRRNPQIQPNSRIISILKEVSES